MEKEAEKVFSGLKKDVLTYAGLKLEYLKLETYERSAEIIAILSHGLILMLFGFFSTLFLALALGSFIGSLTDNMPLGFLIVSALYLLFLIIIIFSKNRIRMSVSNIIIKAMLAKDEKSHEDPTESPGEAAH